jgi:hypothetical protein
MKIFVKIKYLLPKQMNRLAVLGNTGRLQTGLIVWSDPVANLQFLVQRNGHS